MKPRLGLGSWAALVTVVVHTGLALALTSIEEKKPTPPTEITIKEAPPKKKAPPPPPPPPPPQVAAPQPAPQPAPPKPKPAPARRPAPPTPAPAAAPASSAPAAPADFGLKMGNSGGNGPAVGAPAAAAPTETAAPKPPKAKQLSADPAAADGGCSDPIVKPKPIKVAQPAFTQDAQDAGITGKVRVEITVSKTGEVTNARVIEGLGHGLDEAALEAAKQSTFTPATKCGEPVETTFTIGMRFQH